MANATFIDLLRDKEFKLHLCNRGDRLIQNNRIIICFYDNQNLRVFTKKVTVIESFVRTRVTGINKLTYEPKSMAERSVQLVSNAQEGQVIGEWFECEITQSTNTRDEAEKVAVDLANRLSDHLFQFYIK